MKLSTILLCGVISLLLILTPGCKKDDSGPTLPETTGTTGTYSGMIAGGAESGVLTLHVGSAKISAGSVPTPAAMVTITGTLHLTGDTATIPLVGTFNTANDSLYVAGGSYVFLGVYSNGTLNGDYYGPHGIGGFTLSITSDGTVSVYLGTFTSTSGGSSGTLNMVVKNNSLVGLAVSEGEGKTAFTGTIDGLNITVHPDGMPSVTLATGTFSNDHSSASGNYDNQDGNSGAWRVTLSN
jgi:hypothetical protein